jgi:lantibiotic modifying enzyme
MSFLDAAAAIGRPLLAEAIWDEGRCTWIAPFTTDRAEEHRAIGGAIYDGTAGIALFLAHMAAATGDAASRRTALAALRHATSRATLAPEDGFYAGTLGTAWAAARIGTLLGEEEARSAAHDVIATATPAPPDSAAPARSLRGPDLMSGTAGTVAALTGLARELEAPDLIVVAAAHADALLGAARHSRRGVSWRQRGRRRDLLGFAHGAGGIALALLGLDAVAPDARLCQAAAGAFAYEDSWRLGDAAEWPDLRHGPAVSAGNTWCYGLAGMALARVRASTAQIRIPECSRADIAVAAASRELTAALPYAYDDLTLCHGLSGVAHVLLTAGVREPAERLARTAIERHGARGDWPCGPAGPSPTLFRGAAGLGRLFLRLHDPATPSPLDLPGGG